MRTFFNCILKRKVIIILALAIFSNQFKGSAQNINKQDSLALVDLYNSTNGTNWIKDTNWLTPTPVAVWYGVEVKNGRVNQLTLKNNNLTGALPSSLGNLSALITLDLSTNQISGSIPPTFGNFSNIFLDLGNNQLRGPVPATLKNISGFVIINLFNNQFSFDGLEALAYKSVVHYSPQADIPLIRKGNVLSVSAGGTLSNNTFQWYNDTTLVSTKTGDSTFTATVPGNYSVVVTNKVASQLTLYSIGNTNVQDSLALVDFYKGTNGAGWVNHKNWLTAAPVGTWYGVTVRKGRVTQLTLGSNNVTGSLPASLGNLVNLTSLGLGQNQLRGAIPSSLGDLINLKGLGLNENQLSDTIPSSLGKLSNLQTLNLYDNQLTGTIPVSFGHLFNLISLYLSGNQLSGSVPSSFGNLSNLDWFQAEGNLLSGTIPTSLGKLSHLRGIILSNNHLSGRIPDSICLISKLARLELAQNQLTGNIPDSLGNLPNLFSLILDHNQLSGPVPASLNKLYLLGLRLNNNRFTFDGMESLPAARDARVYAPQATIALTKHGTALSVAAGGTLSNDTFRLYKDGVLLATQAGDSSFTIDPVGKYYITVTNVRAPELTLYSDTLVLSTIMLADSTTTALQNITGSSATDINKGNFKLVTLTPTPGANALNGNVTVTVTLNDTVPVFNHQPYVQRHYDIEPATNAAHAQATVTLYFTQQEFDNYNAYIVARNSNAPLLPVHGIDNGNIRITQFHGTFTGTSNPSNYSNGALLIVPTVAWDSTHNWWAVSFPVTGFSGFYLSTGSLISSAAPQLLQFSGSVQNSTVRLQWETTHEENIKAFGIEHSTNMIAFPEIGNVPAQVTPGNHQYTFADSQPLTGVNYYRLKMIDKNGGYTYSDTVLVAFNATAMSTIVYPNPTIKNATLLFMSNSVARYDIEVSDISGKLLLQLMGTSQIGINRVPVDVQHYARGAYFITLTDGENRKRCLKLIKQ